MFLAVGIVTTKSQSPVSIRGYGLGGTGVNKKLRMLANIPSPTPPWALLSPAAILVLWGTKDIKVTKDTKVTKGTKDIKAIKAIKVTKANLVTKAIKDLVTKVIKAIRAVQLVKYFRTLNTLPLKGILTLLPHGGSRVVGDLTRL